MPETQDSVAEGSHYGRWLVISIFRAGGGSGRLRCECRCDCGTEREVDAKSLCRGQSQSCGCLKAELIRARSRYQGRSKSSYYGRWSNMIHRCHDPKHHHYARYGARGIFVCERWRRSFADFMDDMGEKPGSGYSIDRIDNSKGYEPGNCRWATQKEQMNNTSANHLVSLDGESKSIAEWAAISGVKSGTIERRLVRGWDARDAVYMEVSNLRYRSRR